MKTSERSLFRNSFFFLLLITVIGASCTSAEKKRARAERKQHDRDSLALVYDSTKADERLDAFMQRLHSRRSEEHTSELQSLMRISYAVFCLKKKRTTQT